MMLTINDRIRASVQERVDEFVSEGLPNVRSRPEQLHWVPTLKDPWRDRANTAAGCDEDHSSKDGDDAHYSASRDAPHPELLWWVSNLLGRPVTCARDDHRVSLLPGLGDGSEAMPLK